VYEIVGLACGKAFVAICGNSFIALLQHIVSKVDLTSDSVLALAYL
jgi:hypothetical protein